MLPAKKALLPPAGRKPPTGLAILGALSAGGRLIWGLLAHVYCGETNVRLLAEGQTGSKEIDKFIKLLEAQRAVIEDDDEEEAAEAALLRRPQSRRRQPFVHLSGYVGLSGFL